MDIEKFPGVVLLRLGFDAAFWMLDTGCWMRDAGYGMLDARLLMRGYGMIVVYRTSFSPCSTLRGHG